MGNIRSHEDEVTKDVKLVSGMGSLALVTNGKKVDEEDFEYEFSDCDLTKDEYALLVSNPKKFAKKNFGHFKNRNILGNYNSDK